MKNNAHLGETKEHRLKRFQGNPIEIIETLLSSIQSFFNNEIGATFENTANPQTSLMILGVHSVALTIAHGFFNKQGKLGYKLFIERYVDGNSPDTKFSTIAFEIHEWRNVIAHRWLNVAGHEIGYNFDMAEGWRKEGEVIFINPKIYLEHYLKAFDPRQGGMLYRYGDILTTDAMLEAAKLRFLSKYKEEA
jgi:hypothetical protein